MPGGGGHNIHVCCVFRYIHNIIHIILYYTDVGAECAYIGDVECEDESRSRTPSPHRPTSSVQPPPTGASKLKQRRLTTACKRRYTDKQNTCVSIPLICFVFT